MLLPLLVLQLAAGARATPDAFAFFQPTVTITADDRRHLDRGEPVARALPAKDREIAVLAAVRVDIDGDRLVTWMRRIDALKKSTYVLAIGRFSTPPAAADLAGLALDSEELSEILKCRRGDCGLKLSSGEMAQLQQASQASSRSPAALQQAFRELIVQRVNAYLADGHAALQPYEDHAGQTSPATTFARILQNSTFLTAHEPRLVEHLSRSPKAPTADVESFIYWSKERIGGKATISATHVNIVRSREPGMPEALVAAKQIFATHYVNASLGVTAILSNGGAHYLVYLNRSDVDVVGGMFGGLVRYFVQRRLKAEAANVLLGLKQRLEGGEPPGSK
jgi:hypothetical protein